MNEKDRPQDGPGANGLRGGKRVYSKKVTAGNWVDSLGGPQNYKRGFTTSDFETECQHQQIGATMRRPDEYGAALPLPHLVGHVDQMFNGEKTKFLSVLQETNEIMLAKKIEDQDYKPKMTLTREDLEDYRSKWCTDSEHERKQRYEQVESRLHGNSLGIDKFQIKSIRSLPGTPLALEDFRKSLIKRYGVFGLSAARAVIGSDVVPERNFKSLLAQTGITLKNYEFNQIVAFITKDAEAINCDTFFYKLRGQISYSTDESDKLFNAALSRLELGDTSIISLSEYASIFRSNPEIQVGVEHFGACYCSGQDGNLSRSDFHLFMSDICAASPVDYRNIFQTTLL